MADARSPRGGATATASGREPIRRRARTRSLRTRITAAAALVVALVVGAGAVGFYLVLDASVRAATSRAAETRAEELAARIDAQGLGALDGVEDDPAQVLDASGAVLAASDDAEDDVLPAAAEGAVVSYDGERVVVVEEDLDDDRVLRLAVSTEDDAETLSTVAVLLGISAPLVVVVVAALTWWVVGRALRPVARIRAEVDDITADRLERRVPVPPTGDEIAALAATMNGMLDRLEAGARAQRRFVSDASHELRSPLATIRQHAELARLHPETTSTADLAGIVHGEGLRMQALVESLLLLTRLDEGAPHRRGDVDLDDLALGEASRLRSGGTDVDTSGIAPARVHADGRLLAQVVRNLADNAARHARSRVALTTFTDGSRAVLRVDDDGAGIPVAERVRVFERFVRLDEARSRDAGGSGLGLAIVHGIVTSEGGTVAVTDAPAGGARIEVRLPAAS